MHTKCPLLYLTMTVTVPPYSASDPWVMLLLGRIPFTHYIFGHSCCETWSQTYMIGHHRLTFFFYRSRLGFFFFSAPPCPHHCSKTHQPWFKWMGGLTSHCNDSSASSSVRSYLGKVGLLVKCYSLNSMMIETPGFLTQCYNVHWWSGPWCWIIVHPSPFKQNLNVLQFALSWDDRPKWCAFCYYRSGFYKFRVEGEDSIKRVGRGRGQSG